MARTPDKTAAAPDEDEHRLIRVRRDKLEEIRSAGVEPYPYRFQASHDLGDILAEYSELSTEELDEKKPSVALKGRIMSIRRQGKVGFAHFADGSGRLQAFVRRDDVGDDAFFLYKKLDIGDFIGVEGHLMRTRSGELSIAVSTLTLLCKAIRPLPVPKEETRDGQRVVHDAFADKELRYRQRYVDLALNPEVRDVFVKRTRIIKTIRQLLDDRGFLEVETPILQPIYGGATARPFTTHHNSLDMTLYLRIANELYLKRLVVGGLERVYEFAKDFRNEGMDRFHNPEFTMLELYQSYADYGDMMEILEAMVAACAQELSGSMKFTFQGEEIDVTPPWPRLPMLAGIEKHTGIQVGGRSAEELRRICDDLGIETAPEMGAGKLIDEIFSEKVEPHLIQPTFVTDHPVETSPLAKRHRQDPTLTERFEAYVARAELANAFSELNDPLDQRERFRAQQALREQGDDEAQVLDEDFLRALEFGMPPTGGLGVGIDRLVMLLTDSASIRDVVFFPQMRPETAHADPES